MRISLLRNTPQYVGSLTQEVITYLGLECQPGPIYIGPSNIEHIRKRHPMEFTNHLQDIPDIIQRPDYIGVHPRQGGIEFVKVFDGAIRVVPVKIENRSVAYDFRLRNYLLSHHHASAASSCPPRCPCSLR